MCRRTPTMSAPTSPRKRARFTTAKPSTATSTAKPRSRKPRNWWKKASTSRPCRPTSTARTSALLQRRPERIRAAIARLAHEDVVERHRAVVVLGVQRLLLLQRRVVDRQPGIGARRLGPADDVAMIAGSAVIAAGHQDRESCFRAETEAFLPHRRDRAVGHQQQHDLRAGDARLQSDRR